jgi:hypothetical protein
VTPPDASKENATVGTPSAPRDIALSG